MQGHGLGVSDRSIRSPLVVSLDNNLVSVSVTHLTFHTYINTLACFDI